MTELSFKVIASYLLGSVVGSLIVGRLRGGVDIRELGSGNAGGTNALRTQGASFALWVFIIDIGKGWLATGVIAPLSIQNLEVTDPQWAIWLPTACGLAAMCGHVYPVWHGFRGGKGVATLIGVVLGIDAWLLVPMLLTWFAIASVSGFVGLSSILAAASLPVIVGLRGLEPRTPLVTLGLVSLAMIMYTHRANIARMYGGCEPRARRLWLLGRRRA